MRSRLGVADLCRMAERLERTAVHLYEELASGATDHAVAQALSACALDQSEQIGVLDAVCRDDQRPRWWRGTNLPGDQDLYLASLASEYVAMALGLGEVSSGPYDGSVWEWALDAAVRLEDELLALYEDNAALFGRRHAHAREQLVRAKRRHLALLVRLTPPRRAPARGVPAAAAVRPGRGRDG